MAKGTICVNVNVNFGPSILRGAWTEWHRIQLLKALERGQIDMGRQAEHRTQMEYQGGVIFCPAGYRLLNTGETTAQSRLCWESQKWKDANSPGHDPYNPGFHIPMCVPIGEKQSPTKPTQSARLCNKPFCSLAWRHSGSCVLQPKQQKPTVDVPDCGDGYRLLADNETPQRTDHWAFFDLDTGNQCTWSSNCYPDDCKQPLAECKDRVEVGQEYQIRRKIRIQSPGWRYLDIGEMKLIGDGAFIIVGREWVNCSIENELVGPTHELKYRRRIVPNTPEQTQQKQPTFQQGGIIPPSPEATARHFEQVAAELMLLGANKKGSFSLITEQEDLMRRREHGVPVSTIQGATMSAGYSPKPELIVYVDNMYGDDL